MALGDGMGRNKGVQHWCYGRQRDYKTGAEAFLKWLLSNEKYTACTIDTDDQCLWNDVGLMEDNHPISKEELLKEFLECVMAADCSAQSKDRQVPSSVTSLK